MSRQSDTAVRLHGLTSCDTCRRARRWMDAAGASYRFRDLRETPPTARELQGWTDAVGWETLLNRRSTTWRELPEERRTGLDAARAVELMTAHPTLVKRPVVEAPAGIVVGVDEAAWRRLVQS